MYKPINGWTKTKIINHIKKHFTFKSVDPTDKTCLYRGKAKGKVTKCAVGLFIPDDRYNKEMEGYTADHIISNYGLSKQMPLDRKEMDLFQGIHDYGYTNIKQALIDWVEKNVS